MHRLLYSIFATNLENTAWNIKAKDIRQIHEVHLLPSCRMLCTVQFMEKPSIIQNPFNYSRVVEICYRKSIRSRRSRSCKVCTRGRGANGYHTVGRYLNPSLLCDGIVHHLYV